MSLSLLGADLILKCESGHELDHESLKKFNSILNEMVYEVVSRYPNSELDKDIKIHFVKVCSEKSTLISESYNVADKMQSILVDKFFSSSSQGLPNSTLHQLYRYVDIRLIIARECSNEVSRVFMSACAKKTPREEV